jgi:hypothetical protein
LGWRRFSKESVAFRNVLGWWHDHSTPERHLSTRNYNGWLKGTEAGLALNRRRDVSLEPRAIEQRQGGANDEHTICRIERPVRLVWPNRRFVLALLALFVKGEFPDGEAFQICGRQFVYLSTDGSGTHA